MAQVGKAEIGPGGVDMAQVRATEVALPQILVRPEGGRAREVAVATVLHPSDLAVGGAGVAAVGRRLGAGGLLAPPLALGLARAVAASLARAVGGAPLLALPLARFGEAIPGLAEERRAQQRPQRRPARTGRR